MTQASQCRFLTLNIDENLEATLFRMEKGWTLQFVLGPSLADKNVKVFVNHPVDSKAGSNRSLYRKLEWQNLSEFSPDSYDNFAECVMIMAGSFNYYFTINGKEKLEDANGSGFFLVDPILRYGKLDDRLPMDSVRCQTVIAKCLGPFKEWKSRLIVGKESGYNMIHFTPVQELGISNSSYCLKNQLRLNPDFSTKDREYTMKDMAELVETMKNDWDTLSLTDMVFNHTATDSPWLLEHPECSYNMINSPHLKPAYLLDRILWHFSLEVGEGKWSEQGIPAELRTEEHLSNMRRVLTDVVFPPHRLAEFYMVHVDETVYKLKTAILNGIRGDNLRNAELDIISDPQYRRLKSTVNFSAAIKIYYTSQPEQMSRDNKIKAACAALKQHLNHLNESADATIHSHIDCAINNFVAYGRSRFTDGNGLRIAKVAEDEPIMWNYFTMNDEKLSLEQEEENMHTAKGAFCMAVNGWVMSDDPLRNFAAPGSNVYLRRELMPWGDNVKLRFGESPEDCPFLWDYFKSYTQEAARVFHGIRLDNCHSTPIKVAEYLLDEARKVRPDLYVIAELFTSSDYMDNIFINRLGLNSLIREGLHPDNLSDLTSLVHKFGGSPVGSFMQHPVRPILASMAHAMLMDQTHDNESPIAKRSPYDVLPNAAVVAMAVTATGSNRGCDEFIPHHINVVHEKRLYRVWSPDGKKGAGLIGPKDGIIAAKKAMNMLHDELSKSGYDQIYTDKLNDDTMAVTRHNPINHQSIVLIARSAFTMPSNLDGKGMADFPIPGLIDEIIFEGRVTCTNSDEFKLDDKFINGLPGYTTTISEKIKLADSKMIKLRPSASTEKQIIEFVDFPPSSVIALRVSLSAPIKAALLATRHIMAQFGYRMHTFSARNVDEVKGGLLEQAVGKLSLNDLNRILYRCDAEEKDDGKGFETYQLDVYGNMKYCGLQGVISILSKIRGPNDLGHPLCENLRNGDWLMQYTANRLIAHPSTSEIGKFFKGTFDQLAKAPRYLIPCYFDAIVTGVYNIAAEICCEKMSDFVKNGSTFVRQLSWGSVQMCSYMKTSLLPPLSSKLAPPLPPTNLETKEAACLSLSAGLPHFSCGIFRNWGRDTFIALRGLLLITGRYDDARFLILAYAGCLRHGLIPNLLGSGVGARFNCRDAVWFWLKCIEDYCRIAPGGVKILKDKVARMYPKDDSEPSTNIDQTLEDIIQEALQRHADGVTFRERNAGPNIDQDMSDAGFNNSVGIDWKTGFVFGGNANNCGTWMDKMGSSRAAGNYGRPATPRDGSAVELIGLCAAVVKWLGELTDAKQFTHQGVHRTINGTKSDITYKAWYDLIKNNFEAHYWIAAKPTEGEVRPDLINRRGIYKDTLNATSLWTDYQLRPNFPVAICMAPDLVDPEHAWIALEAVKKVLMGPLGIKTLDPSDQQYNGNYINSDESSNYQTAKGFNYHQGPEWLWPVGFFLRAKLLIAARLEAKQKGIWAATVNYVKLTMTAHRLHLSESDWMSLPELTNANGSDCYDSCMAQAWSCGCLLEVLYDLEQFNAKLKVKK